MGVKVQTRDQDMLGNVNRMLLYSGFFSIFSSIAQMGIFDTYLFVLSSSSNSTVGWAESITGLTQVALAIPAGLAADKLSRSSILRGCACLSFVAVGVSIYGILTDNMNVIYLSLFIFGVYAAVQNTTAYALFSDSIPQGSRAKWLTRAGIVNQIGFGMGPMLGLALFVYLGNQWKLSILHMVLAIGFLGMIPANLFLFGWKDVNADEGCADVSPQGAFSHLKYARVVPYLLCFNDVVTCIGAGMTVKFFPLFFKQDYGFGPVQVQLLFAVYGLSFGFFTWLCEKAAGMMGRVQAGLFFSASGVACLFCLAYIEWLPAVLVIFVVRGALANSIFPIDRSIIMDFVPSSERGRWNAVQSISSMSWSGSAVLGGYLMDSYDYRYAFVITAYIYSVASVLRIPLLFIVPRKEKVEVEGEAGDLHKPLVGADDSRPVSAEEVRADILASPRSPNPRHFGQ